MVCVESRNVLRSADDITSFPYPHMRAGYLKGTGRGSDTQSMDDATSINAEKLRESKGYSQFGALIRNRV